MNTISCYSTPEEITSFAIENGYNPTKVKHAQVCYLYHVVKIARAEISAITNYAVSTLSTMRNKVLALWDFAESLFSAVKQKITKTKEVDDNTIIFSTKGTEVEIIKKSTFNAEIDTDSTEKVYLFKFYEPNNSIPIFSKIGTTTKKCLSRLKDEIREYRKNDFNVVKVEMCIVHDCGQTKAEMFESFLRCMLSRDYPNTWKRNDRYFNTDIDSEIFNSYFTEYSKMIQVIFPLCKMHKGNFAHLFVHNLFTK